MVASGLSERISVSQYRLVAHLGLALLIYALMFWTALDLLRPERSPLPRPARPIGLAWLATGIVSITILAGGFVAGLDAGRIYNDFPLMGGQLVPAEAFAGWLSPFEDPATAQFIHRLLALAVVITVAALWLRTRSSPSPGLRSAADLLAAAVLLQIGLGIATLLLVVPVALGAAHQAGAVLLLTASLWALRNAVR
jgi:cytochrome c oxidase assembly protein subunit 15